MNVSFLLKHINNSKSVLVSPKATIDEDTQEILLDDASIILFLWVITLLCLTITVFGLGTNVVNIICFIKQGFKDAVHVSLMGLTISDFCSLLTLIWPSISFNPAFMTVDLPFDTREVQYLTSAMPHTVFTRITSWITAVITMERCLCVTAPLQVKQIITTKRVLAVIVGIFVILITCVAPLYVVHRLGMKFYHERNNSLIGLIYTEDREEVEKAYFLINNTLIPLSAFVVIILCTAKLVLHLQHNTEWRRKSTSSAQVDVVSHRNTKVAKMVVMISVMFIVCFVPLSFVFMAMSMIPGLSIDGKYRNILTVLGGLGFVLESINSSMNIFIYYHMSSKYREAFQMLFLKR